MNKGLRELIKEKAENCCVICKRHCRGTGTPHHVIKLSEEPLLRNCETNVWWTCEVCHTRTENEPGYNHQLQLQLRDHYQTLFSTTKNYNIKEIAAIVNMPIKDIEKASYKRMIKTIDDKADGEEVIRFLTRGVQE